MGQQEGLLHVENSHVTMWVHNVPERHCHLGVYELVSEVDYWPPQKAILFVLLSWQF